MANLHDLLKKLQHKPKVWMICYGLKEIYDFVRNTIIIHLHFQVMLQGLCLHV